MFTVWSNFHLHASILYICPFTATLQSVIKNDRSVLKNLSIKFISRYNWPRHRNKTDRDILFFYCSWWSTSSTQQGHRCCHGDKVKVKHTTPKFQVKWRLIQNTANFKSLMLRKYHWIPDVLKAFSCNWQMSRFLCWFSVIINISSSCQTQPLHLEHVIHTHIHLELDVCPSLFW